MNNYELQITNYEDAIGFLFNSLPVWERAGAGAYKPGLERIAAFTAALGNPQERFRSIHVAGTNGKGSVCHLLAAVLQSAGYRTGLFTSPHLVDFRERIRTDGEMIPRAAVVEFTERWRGEMTRLGLTFFEMATAMAFWWFERAGCEVAIIETGLGGRLDSTNIITPLVSVITNIGLEHTQYLGDTIAAIAAEKAGIIKPGVPVVVGESDLESEPVFRAQTEEAGSEIVLAGENNYELRIDDKSRDIEFARMSETRRRKTSIAPLITNYELDLHGEYQRKNLATVLATIDILRRTFTIPDEALRSGLQNAAAMTGLRGRWQVVGQKPLVVLDTAHNAHGIAEVARQIARQRYDKLYMVLGFAGDKDLDAIIPLLPPRAHYIFTQAATPRAMPAGELARRFGFSTSEITGSVHEAMQRALTLAGPDDMVFVGGSNFIVGEALACLNC